MTKLIGKSFALSLITLFITQSIFFASAQTKTREELQQELTALEEEVKKQTELLNSKKSEGASLSRDVSVLNTQIKKTEAEIKARDKSIQTINYSITDKNRKINSLDAKLDREHISMQAAFRSFQSMSDFTLTEVALAGDSLSEVFDRAKGYSNIEDQP